jgi:hypothetical protein
MITRWEVNSSTVCIEDIVLRVMLSYIPISFAEFMSVQSIGNIEFKLMQLG